MNKLPFDKINFLFLNNYYYHAPCLHFKEIEDIVNSLTEDDIDNDAFNWGYNCDMDRTPVRDSNIYPLISDNLQAFAEGIGLKIKAKIWEPWLTSQDGFLGRQLFWDKEKEEALILVNWKSKKLWKNIPMSEVNLVQKEFEENVKTALNVSENPFELIYEGELDKQR